MSTTGCGVDVGVYKVRPCGFGGWAYCNGRCWTCQSHASVATTSTHPRDFRLDATAQYTTVVTADKE